MTAANPLAGSASALNVLLDGDRSDAAVLREVAELLSHELRTPLTTIYSGSKILNRPGVRLSDATVREVSAAIEAEAERLKRIVEDLVVATGPDERAIGPEPVLIQHLLPAIVANEQERWPTTRFVVSIPEHLPAVRGDSGALEQVLRNLLVERRAVRATGRRHRRDRPAGTRLRDRPRSPTRGRASSRARPTASSGSSTGPRPPPSTRASAWACSSAVG